MSKDHPRESEMPCLSLSEDFLPRLVFGDGHQLVARLVSEGLRARHPGGSECDESARSRWMRPALQGIKPPARRGARVTKGRRGEGRVGLKSRAYLSCPLVKQPRMPGSACRSYPFLRSVSSRRCCARSLLPASSLCLYAVCSLNEEEYA